MLIGHYMHGLWSPGGVASYLRSVSAAQERLGHQVTFFDSVGPSGPNTAQVADGNDLVAAARRASVDVLHLHLGPPGGFPGGIPSVRTVHGHHHYCPSGSQFLERRSVPCDRIVDGWGCSWGHLVDHCGSRRPTQLLADFRRTRHEQDSARYSLLLAVSEFVRGRLLRAGYDESRIRVLPNPSPVPPVIAELETSGPPRFLFMGRIVAAKGLGWLVEALARAEARPLLDVLGTGPDEDRVRRLVAERHLDSRVFFHGWLHNARVPAFLATARAVVAPSLWQEPAGLVAIEAAMHGRAVIAGAVGGLPEIVIDGTTGLLVPPGDTQALARALDRLSGDTALAARLGAAARQRAARLYALDAHVERLMESYAEVA